MDLCLWGHFLRCFPLYDNDHSLVALAAYLVSVADFSLMWRAFLDYVYVQSYKLSVFFMLLTVYMSRSITTS